MKKETTISVLKEIKELLVETNHRLGQIIVHTAKPLIESTHAGIESTQKSGNLSIFPQKTAKEILKECDNKVPGGKLLYSGLDGWYKNEDFFTKETCRPDMLMNFTEILHKGKSWDECNELKGENEMLNFAEVVYLLANHSEFRSLIGGYKYTWTSSRDSGGSLVSVGDFGSRGADVSRWEPGRSGSDIGVCFSRS